MVVLSAFESNAFHRPDSEALALLVHGSYRQSHATTSPSSREISRWAGCLQSSRSLPASVPGLTTCHAPPRHPGMKPCWFRSSSADYHPPRPEPWACDELVTARARSKGSPWWQAAVPPLSGGAATPALAAVAPRPLPPLPREARDVVRAAPTRWNPWE